MHTPISILDDATTDFYTSKRTKRSMHFHTSPSTLFDFIYTPNSIPPSAFNVVFVQRSNEFPEFFQSVRREYFTHPTHPHTFWHLSLTRLNDLVLAMHQNPQHPLWASVPDREGFPTKFSAACWRLTKMALRILPPGVVRAYTSLESRDGYRLTCRFYGGDFVRPKFTQAQRFEMRRQGPSKLQTSHLTPKESIGSQGPMCFVMKPCMIEDDMVALKSYLDTLCASSIYPSTESQRRYRFEKQLQSKHYPRYHGETGYRAPAETKRILDKTLPLLEMVITAPMDITLSEICFQTTG